MQSDRLKAYQNANLLDIFQRGVELAKPADEEVADQTVEKTGILLEDIRKPITQTISGFISEKGEVK